MWSEFRSDVGINDCIYLETAKLIRKSVPVCEFVFGDRDARRSPPWRPFGSDDMVLNLVPKGLGYFNASKSHDCAF